MDALNGFTNRRHRLDYFSEFETNLWHGCGDALLDVDIQDLYFSCFDAYTQTEYQRLNIIISELRGV